MSDENLDIPLDDETKPVDVAVGAAPAPGKAPQSEQEGIEDFKVQAEKARAESTRRLAEADRKIREAYELATKQGQELAETRRDNVAGTIERLTLEKDSAKRDLRAALEANDPEKIADAQDKLSLSNARIVEAEKGKLALDEEVKSPAQRPGAPQPLATEAPVEIIARNLEAGGNRRSAEWIRSHPEYANGGRLGDKLAAAHHWAVSEGHPIDSDDYFKTIEGMLGLSDDQSRRAAAHESTRAPVSAPVTRSAPSNGTASRRMPATIRLTPEEVRIADEMGVDRKDYARELWNLAQEGKISRAF